MTFPNISQSRPAPKKFGAFLRTKCKKDLFVIVYITNAGKEDFIMGDCCVSNNNCGHSCGGCNFDLDMILWVLIIIVIVTCMCNK